MKSTTAIISGLFLLAAVFLSDSLYMGAKARMAQFLLEEAWTRTVKEGKDRPPWPWADVYPVARLSLPGHRLSMIVLSGVSGEALAFGPGHWSNSARPGEAGNCVLAGHRDTHFSFMRYLRNDDRIVLEDRHGRKTVYGVDERYVTDYRDLGPLADASDTVLTLITCYPFDSLRPGGPLRYIVRASKVPSKS